MASEVEFTNEMVEAGRKAISDERTRVGLQYPDTLAILAYQAMAPLDTTLATLQAKLVEKDAEIGALLAEMEPHIRRVAGAVRINDEWGRVVNGQTEAATALKAIYDRTRPALTGESDV